MERLRAEADESAAPSDTSALEKYLPFSLEYCRYYGHFIRIAYHCSISCLRLAGFLLHDRENSHWMGFGIENMFVENIDLRVGIMQQVEIFEGFWREIGIDGRVRKVLKA